MSDGQPENATENAEQPEGMSGEDRIAYVNELMEGLPPVSLGAMFMPPVWGFGHGDWVTILFYPLWVFVDNILFAAYSQRTALSIIMAVIVFAVMVAITVAYARLSAPRAAMRAASNGKTKEQHLRSERIWAVTMGLFALVLIIIATWYNLCVRSAV